VSSRDTKTQVRDVEGPEGLENIKHIPGRQRLVVVVSGSNISEADSSGSQHGKGNGSETHYEVEIALGDF
jgi:hypothetical protein